MKIINSKIKNLLEGEIVALSTVNNSGEPHSIAIAYPKVVSKSKVVITDNFMEETVNNIKTNSSVSLLVWSKDWEDVDNCYGYELKGECEYHDSGKWKEFVENMEENEEFPAKGALLVKAEKIKELS